jgi:hypothetical protein
MFTARYGLIPYKRILRFVFKNLNVLLFVSYFVLLQTGESWPTVNIVLSYMYNF